ncbi:MAG: hypothetical protein KatS3mg087_1100 [Patescibacteria group bacterium]|nr:MAG: hypothetical protein KatS3mg087_1100 [Patescibacteria group bacterium]
MAIAETVDNTDAENAESQVFAYYENAITQCQNKDRLPQIVQDVLADNRLSKEEKEMLRGYARSMWQSMK